MNTDPDLARNMEAALTDAQISVIDSVFGAQHAIPLALYDMEAVRFDTLSLTGAAQHHLRVCMIEGRSINGVPTWLHIAVPAVAAVAGLSAAAIPGFPAAAVFGVVGVLAAAVAGLRAWGDRHGGTRATVRRAAVAAYVCDTDLPEALEARSLINQCYELQVWDGRHVTDMDVRRLMMLVGDVLTCCVAAELADDEDGWERQRAQARVPLHAAHRMVWQLKASWMAGNAPRPVVADAAAGRN